MLEYLRRALMAVVRQHQAALVLAAIVLTAGIVTGALQVARLDPSQQTQVGQYLDYLMATAPGARPGETEGVAAGAGDPAGAPAGAAPWQPAVGGNLRQVAVAWAAGFLVLGLPVTLGVLFLHGYSLGFAVAAMAAHWQWRGLVVALAAVFPPNLLQLPALALVAAAATRLAVQVAASRVRRDLPTLASPWSPYLALGALATLLALGAAWVEVVVAPALLGLTQRLVF